MDFSVVSRAGLSQRDLSKIVGVSHVAVNFWFRGKSTPDPIKPYYPTLEKAIALLTGWVNSGKLPVKFKDRAHRARVLEKIQSAVLA